MLEITAPPPPSLFLCIFNENINDHCLKLLDRNKVKKECYLIQDTTKIHFLK